MDTEQLRYFIEVSKNTSIAAASEKLFMTSQAVSISIKKLEDELGFPLLNRSYKGISLTDEGLWLVTLAENFLSEIEQKKNQYSIPGMSCTTDSPSREGLLNIVTNVLGAGNSVLAQLVCILYKKHPKLQITITETLQREMSWQKSSDRKERIWFYLSNKIKPKFY